jgi:AhpC/TSA family
MMMKYAVSLVVLMTCLAPRIGLGGLIGEPAPPLVVKEWIKGQPVEIKPGTNIYVVEIWQSSVPACRAAITNLNRLQTRFRPNGVVIVGIADESVEKIKEVVLHEGTNIQYAIAADDRRKTALSYMTPVKQRGIPYTFVVGTNGNVLWHGLPLAGLNQALEQITAGQYDMEPFRKSEVAAHQMEQYLGLARRGDFRSKSAGATLLANRTNDVALLCDMAYQITTAPRLANRDFALAGEALDQAEKLSVTNKAPVTIIRAVWLFTSGKQDAGMILATQAINSAQSPMDKNRIQLLLRTMEAHLAAAKTNQGNTNQINAAHSSDQVPVANTNQSNTNQSKGPAGKP